ncbi:carbon-phosphorus lyase complex subunit PhnI [Fundidesulfovibrio butyratiphilus]
MYVAVKGGERAIDNAHALLAERRRGDAPELGLDQIMGQMKLAVDRVMAEGNLYDPELAALAVKQAWGDLVEAAFLLRAYRTTLPRLYSSRPVDTAAMAVTRRISAAFKDLPGGQVLGPTFDYTHRLLDFSLAGGAGRADAPTGAQSGSDRAESEPEEGSPGPERGASPRAYPRVSAMLEAQGLVDPEACGPDAPDDLTRAALSFPASRALRLQSLARADEGFLLALGYSTQRGFGNAHPFAGEIRQGAVEVEIVPEELGFAVCIGEIELTECEMITQFRGDANTPPRFTKGYGLVFGLSERKAMAMALVDRSLQAEDLGEEVQAPAQDQEFVLLHGDNVEAMGFVQHLKLPHYVDFQSELAMIRAMRAKFADRKEDQA